MVNQRLLDLANRMKNDELPNLLDNEILERKKKISKVSSIRGDCQIFGGALAQKIHDKIVRKYGENHPLVTQNVQYSNGIIRGSKPGYVIAIEEVFREDNYDLSVATSYDVHKAIKEGKLDLRGCYEDLGLVLYDEKDPNSYFAKDLIRQIKSRQGNLEFPILLPLNNLTLSEDRNAPNNLSYKLIEDSNVIIAPQLSPTNNQRKFSEIDINGLPIFDDAGEYTFYSGNNGLTMLYRGRYLYLGAGNRYLAYSGADGRVNIAPQARAS